MQKNSKKIAIFSFLVLFLATVFFGSPVAITRADSSSEIQDNIDKLEKKLQDAQAAKLQLEKQLTNINYSVAQTQKDIQLTESIIRQVEDEISRSEKEIAAQDQKMGIQRQILSGLLQEMYYDQHESAPLIILAEQNFSSIFRKSDNLITLQEKINELIDQIKGMQSATIQAKSELEVSQQQKEKLLTLKQQQKQSLLGDKAETEGDIDDKEAVIARLNKELSELQSDLATITGKSYNAKDIEEAVGFASDKSGVPKGFLFGMLKMESNLGANVGGCTYGDVEKGAEASYKAKKLGKTAWATFQRRREIFKTICSELDIDYKKQKVSCNPRGYVGTGGAMGVAQFMPDTWMAYKSQVTSKTGNNPPSPWNLTDGVMAMALKLARTPGVTSGKTSAYKSAACSYLGTCYAPYINGILYWAKNYKQLL